MRRSNLSFRGIGGLLLLIAAGGCQSLSGRSAETELQSSAHLKTPVTLTGGLIPARRAQEVRKTAPVHLTGITAEDASDEALETPVQKTFSDSDRKAAAARDVRPIFLGQRGISDPNAEPPSASWLRQASGEESQQPARSGLLLGDDPSNLFLSPQAGSPASPLEGDSSPFPGDQPSPITPRLPSLLPPQPTAKELASDGSLHSGPQQPEPGRLTFSSDLKDLGDVLWDDTKSLFTWQNAAIIGVAAGGAVAIRETGVDQDVRMYTLGHEKRWGEGSVVLRQFGEPLYQIPVLAGIYGVSLWQQDHYLHDYSCALVDAYGLNGITTVTIKWIADTQRPTSVFYNGRWGFPSFHTSSLFTIGAVTDEYYGWQVGLPVYVLGGLVGWSRIDQREHDLSDVLFGAVLGFVIGKSVAYNHRHNLDGREWKVQPYYDPQNGVNGVTLETKF